MRSQLPFLLLVAAVSPGNLVAQSQPTSRPGAAQVRAPTPQTRPTQQVPAGTSATKPPADVEALAKMLDGTHRPGAMGKKLDAFHALLSIQTLARDRDAITVNATARYQRESSRGRPRELMNLQLQEGSVETRMGVDLVGPWMVINGRTESLRGQERRGDRQRVFQQLAFARQLLRFSDPGAILRQLVAPSTVTERTIKRGRRGEIACFHVKGRIPDFPVYGGTKGTGATTAQSVELEILVAMDTGRLLQVTSRPIRMDAVMPAGERFVFGKYQLQDGVLLPRSMTILPIRDGVGGTATDGQQADGNQANGSSGNGPSPTKPGAMASVGDPIRVQIGSIDLTPEFTPESLLRPR